MPQICYVRNDDFNLCLPLYIQTIGSCTYLVVLDVSSNKLQLFPLELGQLKLKEFYFENNPLLPHIPVPAEQECEVLPLRVRPL